MVIYLSTSKAAQIASEASDVRNIYTGRGKIS